MQTYEEALLRHTPLRAAAEVLKQKGVTDAASLWLAIVDAKEEPADDTLAEALRLTMATDDVPVVRQSSGVAAAFLVETCSQLFDPKRDKLITARLIWKAWHARADMADKVENGYGCDKSASWEHARELSGTRDAAMVEQIAIMAGRMYKVLRGARTINTDDPQQVKNVTLGGDVERLVAAEIAQLATPGLDDAAAIRILEKRAQQYKMVGKTSAQRGPLVICLDESDSMTDDSVGGRNTWAKACAVALTRVAHEGNRMVKVVHFATSNVTSACNPGDAKGVLDMSRHFLGGGTDIARALLVAAKEVGNLALEGFVGADIVLVTDGEDYSDVAQERVLSIAQAQGVRLWTVSIECEVRKDSPLRTRAQEVVRVGATDRADFVAALRGAAENTVDVEDEAAQAALTPEEKAQQAKERAAQLRAMN